jgi:transcriptional regulator with XRE-family HTH domain
MTQAQLAKRLGTSAVYVSVLETGRTNPTVGQLFAVAMALGVEFDVRFNAPAPVAEPAIPELT